MSTNSFNNEYALGEVMSRVHPKVGRVIVTGGSGKLGRSVVSQLASEGYEVINLDLKRIAGSSEDGKSNIGGAYRIIEVNLEDMGQVLESFMEIDMAYKGKIVAVVHLAAIPSPGQTSSSNQFRTNTMSTYNVLEACRKLSIKNVVVASSETLIGLPFPVPPPFLPITEETPRAPESAYSLSKLLGEVMAEEYARWDKDLKIVSLRFSNVMVEKDYEEFESWQGDWSKRIFNVWGYIDARDGAQAVSLALKKDYVGHHVYLIANNNTTMRMPNSELVAKGFPDVKIYKPTAGPNDTLLSIEKAKRELGYSPKFDWKH